MNDYIKGYINGNYVWCLYIEIFLLTGAKRMVRYPSMPKMLNLLYNLLDFVADNIYYMYLLSSLSHE